VQKEKERKLITSAWDKIIKYIELIIQSWIEKEAAQQ